MREKEKNMAKKNYYAVKQGKVPGIYRTWDACKAQVHGYPGAIYKGFELENPPASFYHSLRFFPY